MRKSIFTLLIACMGMFVFGQTAITKPVISLPANGATKQAPNVLVKWGAVPGAFSYTLQVDIDTNFTNPDSIVTPYTAANTANLFFGDKHFCRVKAHSLNNTESSAWSNVSVFYVIDTVTVIKPNISTTNSYSRAFINWTLISGSTGYEYQIDSSLSFSSPYFVTGNFGITGIGYSKQLYYGTDYFFRMRAIDSRSTSSWSKPIPFATTNTVKLVAPHDTSKKLNTEVIFNWKTNGAYFYKYQISTDTNFSVYIEHLVDSTYIVTSAIDTSVFVDSDTLLFDTKYFWKVQSINEFDTSGWSQINSFTTFQLVNPLEPLNNSTNVSCLPLFKWTNIEGVRNFIIEADTSVSFANPKTYTVPGYLSQFMDSTHAFLNYTNYHWRIKATNYNDSTLWCATQNFKTGPYTSVATYDKSDFCEFYPNPAKNYLNININSSTKSLCEISIINIMGQYVKTEKFNLNSGNNNKQVNISNIADGVYFINIKFNNETLSRKLIINK